VHRFDPLRWVWAGNQTSLLRPRVNTAKQANSARGRPGSTRHDRFAARLASERACCFALGDGISHALHIAAGHVACPEIAD
jgi:hypothetical protein